MANLGGMFDATQVDPTNDFEQLPAGQYEAQVVESRLEPISKDQPGKGECLTLVWKVISGPLDGRLIWQRLNLWFSGAEKTPGKVAEIAQRQLSEVCHATGQMNITDSEQLHYRPCLVRYGPQKSNSQYNEVKSVQPVGGKGAAPSGQPSQASQPPFGSPPAQSPGAPSGGGWKRRTG